MKRITIILFFIFLGKELLSQKKQIETLGFVYYFNDDKKDSFLTNKRVYDIDSNLIEECTFYYQDDKFCSTHITYTSTKKIDWRESYLMDSAYYQKTTFYRNAKGDLERQVMIDKNGETILVHDNKYDSIGRLFKSNIVSDKSRVDSTFPKFYSLYKYDDLGNLIELKQFQDDSVLRCDSYKYDSNNRRVEEQSIVNMPNHKENTRTTFTKNELDCIIHQENYLNDVLESIVDRIWEGKILKHEKIRYFQDNSIEEIFYIQI